MSNSQTQPTKKFGTFLGVYLPSILTILGLIMYLRFGWIVGNLGLGLTLVVVLVANLITFISGLSASAIATNIKVGVGGVYYLVSRSLGLETGGAIGVAFYISRTLSITFYSFGLAEAILLFWPVEAWGPMPGYMIQAVTAMIIVVITLMAGKSAELVLKIQIPILILVVLSILALIGGALLGEWQSPQWTPNIQPETGGFWAVFAVFFPGVTGFLAGIAMSGDLKNPGKSIPRGTIASVITGTIIYLIIPVALAVSAAVTIEELRDPNLGLQTWSKVALFGGLFIYPAAWGAIFSSAIGSILSGPRVLQSLSNDGLAPKFLSKVSKTGQPTIATWVTGGIALAAVALGGLNTVAKFVTVLFLTLYVVINLVAAMEKLVAEPSYRPKINIPWYVSMAGAVAALFVMYLISPVALVLALGLEFACYFYFRNRALKQKWGDVNAGFWMRVARFAMLRISSHKMSPRNWRPFILVFVRDIKERIQLVKFAAAFGQNRGVLTISKMINEKDEEALKSRKEIQLAMIDDLKPFGLEAFCEVTPVTSFHQGILDISKGHGLAGLKTNTVIFGWSGNLDGNINQLKIIRQLAVAGKNILLVKFNHEFGTDPKKHKKIDLWWSGYENNGDLMLIFAYMLQLNRSWDQAQIHINAVVNSSEEGGSLKEGIQNSIEAARILAKVNILISDGEPFQDILKRQSKDADVVFLGLKSVPAGEEMQQAQKLEILGRIAPTVIFMQNNSMKETMPILLEVRNGG